jgi:quinol monooxygenase YgiN
MSKQAVQFNVDLTINEGKLDALRGIIQAMIAGTQKEPGALGYEWYLSARSECRGPFDCFASRNSHSAQDDNLGMEIVS